MAGKLQHTVASNGDVGVMPPTLPFYSSSPLSQATSGFICHIRTEGVGRVSPYLKGQ